MHPPNFDGRGVCRLPKSREIWDENLAKALMDSPLRVLIILCGTVCQGSSVPKF
jgi:hypothetical protein